MPCVRAVSVAGVLAALAVSGPCWFAAPAAADVVELLCTASAQSCSVTPLRPAPASIPAPTGTHRVGRIDAHLADGGRELMVSAWYPAVADERPAPYLPAGTMTGRAHIAWQASNWLPALAAAPLVGATAPATWGAAVDPAAGRLPVLVWSPGLGTPRWLGSGLAADLASKGWLVVTVDHTGESPVVEFPGERIIVGQPVNITDREAMRRALETRVADMRLVLDSLPALPEVGERIDPERIAAAGHSYGGYTAVLTAARDHRVKAAVVLDGSVAFLEPSELERAGVNRPVLVLAAGDMVHASWISFGQVTPGPFALATIRSGAHYVSTDLPALGGTPVLCGTVPPDRAAMITRAVTAGFLDKWLHGGPDDYGSWPELDWRTR
ncbi:alpha/beta hydrolase family protein [Nocardia sp. NPDC127526]|uniref:alpha/beta hydrolase family protein n=1 Tax=Nocardia sp. NPDC127526 TaxID=3345393 RepID=UPI0036310C2D